MMSTGREDEYKHINVSLIKASLYVTGVRSDEWNVTIVDCSNVGPRAYGSNHVSHYNL